MKSKHSISVFSSFYLNLGYDSEHKNFQIQYLLPLLGVACLIRNQFQQQKKIEMLQLSWIFSLTRKEGEEKVALRTKGFRMFPL